ALTQCTSRPSAFCPCTKASAACASAAKLTRIGCPLRAADVATAAPMPRVPPVTMMRPLGWSSLVMIPVRRSGVGSPLHRIALVRVLERERLLDSRPHLDALPPIGDARPAVGGDRLRARQDLDAVDHRRHRDVGERERLAGEPRSVGELLLHLLE